MPNDNPKEVSVTETGEGKFSQSIQIGKHSLISDESEEVGGNNKGPEPYGLLLASLGACTSMTLRLYAERKNILLKRVRVILTHEKVYDKDKRLDLIHRTIYVEGSLTPEQENSLLRIAEKCPIYKTLMQSAMINTTITSKEY